MAEASMLQPMYSDELARQERGIERQSSAMLSGAQLGAGLGAQATGRTQAEQEAAMSGGEVQRGAEQDVYNATYDDLMRRQAIAEEALFVPFGTIVPSAMGQTSYTDADTEGK
jgi:hypothetical protein